jgi:hypothetical protein
VSDWQTLAAIITGSVALAWLLIHLLNAPQRKLRKEYPACEACGHPGPRHAPSMSLDDQSDRVFCYQVVERERTETGAETLRRCGCATYQPGRTK